MYDFILGDVDFLGGGVEAEKNFLLSVKRMLPRWCNSIPDSEFLAIYDVLSEGELVSPYFVETGSGASTLVFFWFAMKNKGKLYSWDINGSKLYFLRTVIQDAILRMYSNINIWDVWCPIAAMSTGEYTGIKVLNEFEHIRDSGIGACFLDSEHTIGNLLEETKQVLELMKDGSIIIIDDSNYRTKYVNVPYANMIRKKMGLQPKYEPKDNISELTFGESVYKFLSDNTKKFEQIEDSYKEHYKEDLFWSYYSNDRENMAKMDMEKYDNLAHRFDAWKIIEK